FLEDVAYGTRRGLAETAAPLLTPALRLRCVRAILRCVSDSDAAARTASRPLLPAEVLTRLDQSDGLARFHRNDAQSATVVQHFRHTLQSMVQLCRERKVPLVFVQPPVNLADCPPFKTQFAVDAEQQRQVLELLQRARAEAA
ncbi:MAG TPA: hypothetical protein DCX79_11540, partial [Planctomycetaceae bacterium]|nr:hypothetical protein [Planctomycetaceae bacterium]